MVKEKIGRKNFGGLAINLVTPDAPGPMIVNSKQSIYRMYVQPELIWCQPQVVTAVTIYIV